MNKNTPDIQRLRETLAYNPNTGEFTWLVQRHWNSPIGSIAGNIGSNGYYHIKLFQKQYALHRLAWLYVTGEWPEFELDHINGMPTDNRWANLRTATSRQNHYNMRGYAGESGIKGVSVNRIGRWRARICTPQGQMHLGTFDTVEEAAEAYQSYATKLHGSFYTTRGNSTKDFSGEQRKDTR